jgi:hypothetical protein
VKVKSLKLPRPKELKRFIVIDMWEDTHGQIVNFGRKKTGEVETSEVRSPEVD